MFHLIGASGSGGSAVLLTLNLAAIAAVVAALTQLLKPFIPHRAEMTPERAAAAPQILAFLLAVGVVALNLLSPVAFQTLIAAASISLTAYGGYGVLRGDNNLVTPPPPDNSPPAGVKLNPFTTELASVTPAPSTGPPNP